MKYEVVRKIENDCARNQMRDVLFQEVDVESPEVYVRSLLRDRDICLTVEELADGCRVITAEGVGLLQIFHFTPLD